VYLDEGHLRRTEHGKDEEIRHSPGYVVWRDRSEHQIEDLEETDHEVLIIELKH
jgi:hypothetical protein